MRKKMAAGVLILSLLAAVTGCGSKQTQVQAQSEARAMTVSVAKVGKSDMITKLTVSGKISAAEEVRVVPKATGKVSRVAVDVGRAVAAGDILFELDNTDIQARLDSARATLAASEANLEKAAAQLEKSKMQVEDSGRNLERKKSLYENGAVSLVDYESAKSSYEAAKKDCEMNAAGLASSRAAVDQSRASVKQSEVDMENSLVRSPISGVVATRSVNAGEFVSNSTAAIVVVNIGTVEVNASLNEGEVNSIKPGQEVDVAVPAVSPAAFKGRVTKVSPYGDSKNKTYPVWVSVANPEQLLKPGMFAEIQLVASKKEGVLAVTAGAVVERNGQKVVYLADGEKAVERKVNTGMSEGGKIEITEGLAEGDLLILTGLQAMRNGAPIKVQAPSGDKGGGKKPAN